MDKIRKLKDQNLVQDNIENMLSSEPEHHTEQLSLLYNISYYET